MTITLEAAEQILREKVLQDNPFPDAVTGRNEALLECLAGFAEEQRARVEGSLERLRRSASPEDWELSALGHALHEWRIYEAFRALHEAWQCPALLFHLRTKTDLLTLCDPKASSASEGFTDRAKKVLAKRGIDQRFLWCEARRLVGRMGLLQSLPPAPATSEGERSSGPEPVGEVPVKEESAETTAVDEAHEGGPRVVLADEADVSAHDEAPAARRVLAADAVSPAAAADQGAPAAWPEVRLDPVVGLLPGYTKTQLEAVYKRMECGLWRQFGDRFYGSFKKGEMIAYVRRLLRFHANLEAVQHLTEPQLDTLFEWMRTHLRERLQRDDDLRIAARLLADFLSVADKGSLSPDAWNRYRDAELRRIGAFCYNHFYAGLRGALPVGGAASRQAA